MIKVLVTNDDGINSPGLKALVKGLALFAEVYVAAPDSQKSGMSHSLTLGGSMEVTKVNVEDAKGAYKIAGHPVDCVKYGIQKFAQEGVKFDFVFSGINQGANLGRDVHYSGTVGAAMEGAIQGVRSIALSVGDLKANRFGYTIKLLPEIIKISEKFPTDIVINVNVPSLPAGKIKGVKFIGGKLNIYQDLIEEHDDGTFCYEGKLKFPEEQGTDVYYFGKGYVTIAPLRLDWIDMTALAKLNGMAGHNPACVLIDYQEKLFPVMRKSKELMTNVTKFARCLDRLDIPVVVSQQYSKGLGNTIPELRNALGKFEKVEKLDFSCFGAPGFEEMFQTMLTKDVIIAGIEAHICVLQTALDFLDRGFKVTVITDCCSSRNKEDYEAAMNLLEKRGCNMMTWEMFVYMQMGSATNPAFKTISEIVKE